MENNSLSRESKLEDKEYKWGFTTDVDTEVVPKGLNEDVVKLISQKKNEPEWQIKRTKQKDKSKVDESTYQIKTTRMNSTKRM